MIEYSIYQTSTGIIKQAGTAGSEADVQRVLRDGMSYILEMHDPMTHKIVDGSAVALDETRDLAAENRERRNALLAVCDWTQVPDSPLSDADKTAWQTYRQALRDLPTHANWPDLQPSDFPNKPA